MKRNVLKTAIISASLVVSLFSGCSFRPEAETETSAYQTRVNSVVYDTLSNEERAAYNTILKGVLEFEEQIDVKGEVDDINTAFVAVTSDHPEVFYTNGYVYNEKQNVFGKTTNVILFPKYTCDKTEYETLLMAIDESANELTAQISDASSQYEISRDVYTALIDYIEYDTEVDANDTIVAAFLEGKASCGGYGGAYAYLMQRMGVPCARIAGEYEENAHIWNVSLIDESAYLSDLTNGDSIFESSDGSETHVTNYSYLNMLPAFTEKYVSDLSLSSLSFENTAANYFVNTGTYFSGYNRDAVTNAIKNATTEEITLAFDSMESLQCAQSDLFTNKNIQSILGNVNVNYVVDAGAYTLTIFL